ncbi:hypothetical protein [uncultured Jannaschia sp.]|uniref:hypothetical protein n=1 Tax=uncultured Jannaschia sp. TaxID=293347 RepID=UPI00261E4277|nr:hypothetical protein [uncultured Jannaschia sp.]
MDLCRRTMLTLLAATLTAGPSLAQPAEIRGTVVLADGTTIPKGMIAVELETGSGPSQDLRLDSDGRAKAVEFALPAGGAGPGSRIVVHLERADGWLLARGSAPVEPGAPVAVTLHPVMYGDRT